MGLVILVLGALTSTAWALRTARRTASRLALDRFRGFVPTTGAREPGPGTLFSVPVVLARYRQPREDVDEVDHERHADQHDSGGGRDRVRANDDHEHAGEQDRARQAVADEVYWTQAGHGFKITPDLEY